MRLLVGMLAVCPMLLGGCVVKTAYTVATVPVKAGGKVVDWTTTSQAEADRNYGRRMRHEEEREGRERRAWAKRCRNTPGDPDCREYNGFRAGQRG